MSDYCEDDDLRLAQQLQDQFDDEAAAVQQKQEVSNYKLAHKLVSNSHSLSDSGDEAEAVDNRKNRKPSDVCSPKVSSDKSVDNSRSKASSSGTRRKEHLGKRANEGSLRSTEGERRTSEVLKTPKQIQECPFGDKCYRQANRIHMAEFSHPKSRGSDADAPPSKMPRLSKTTISDRLKLAEPISLFLTKVRDVRSTWRERLSVGIAELLDPSLGELKSSLQLNFMVDVDWLLEAYSVYRLETKPLTIVHGSDGVVSPSSNVTVQKVAMPFPFGTHHTKLMVFEYTTGIRIVIHTANLVESDWTNKTQGLWISPLLPPAKSPQTSKDSPTGFQTDFLRYLTVYNLSCLAGWKALVSAHDFSSLRVFFISSVPGRHLGPNRCRWGHLRVKEVLQKQRHGPDSSRWPLVIQCSSIGSLGSEPHSWVTTELASSLGGRPREHHVIYPTERNVRESVEGYDGGSCLPYHHRTHVKQLWLAQCMRQWRSETRSRSNAMPHVKTYAQLSPDNHQAAWFMLTSSNLSKAAWGALEKQGSQLFIRSYEAGVLFVPSMFDCENFKVAQGDESRCDAVNLPYSLPLVSYDDDDKPWFMDRPHSQPDAFGKMLLYKGS